MIDWVDEMCRSWGRQKRRIIGEPALLQDPVTLCSIETQNLLVRGIAPSGFARGISGRIVDEGPVGAAIGQGQQPDPREVLLGDALKVSIAIQKAIYFSRMTERQYESLFIHYVLRGNRKRTLEAMRIGRKCHYDRVNRAQKNLEPWLDCDNVTGDNVVAA